MNATPAAAPAPTTPPYLRQIAVIYGAIGVACEVLGTAPKIKAATSTTKIARIMVFSPYYSGLDLIAVQVNPR
jgi:hypothetical protein